MTNTDTRCLTCGHADPHFSPAIDLGIPVDGDWCPVADCSCRAFVPTSSTSARIWESDEWRRVEDAVDEWLEHGSDGDDGPFESAFRRSMEAFEAAIVAREKARCPDHDS